VRVQAGQGVRLTAAFADVFLAQQVPVLEASRMESRAEAGVHRQEKKLDHQRITQHTHAETRRPGTKIFMSGAGSERMRGGKGRDDDDDAFYLFFQKQKRERDRVLAGHGNPATRRETSGLERMSTNGCQPVLETHELQANQNTGQDPHKERGHTASESGTAEARCRV